MKKAIVERDTPVLREMAKEVPPKDIGTRHVKGVISRMKKALHAEDDGVAIAAPQIGESLRIFVVNGETLASIERKKAKRKGNIEAAAQIKDLPDQIFINPNLTKLSKKKRFMEEGCLSVRWLYGEVERSEKATLDALDEEGKKVHIGASGLLAQIFQHEVDHLNGILFVDKARNVEEIPPESDHE